MAFSKYARANLIKPDINVPAWDGVLNSAGTLIGHKTASHVNLGEFNPKEFMLSHCTIVASVDTEASSSPLGNVTEGNTAINRQFADYLIAPKTSKWVNNNHDAWERKLLLSCFRSFVGGENYVEHVQIPELSKGKILDAAARDIGDSVYIDILVATNRKFKPLISSIRKREMQTLSMGCTTSFTICSYCGNVAADDTQLCPHIKYQKGNTFVDSMGVKRVVAELCGHIDHEPGSVKFIEASWVGTPAFEGAVLKDTLDPEALEKYATIHKDRLSVAFNTTHSIDPFATKKVAFLKAAQFNFDDAQGGQQQGAEAQAKPPAPEAELPLEKAVKDTQTYIVDEAVNRTHKDISDRKVRDQVTDQNNTLIREASRDPQWRKIAHTTKQLFPNVAMAKRVFIGLLKHNRGGWKAVKSASEKFSGREFLAISKALDVINGVPTMAGEERIYRTVIAVGGAEPYQDENLYLTACGRVLGRVPNKNEEMALVVKGKLFDLGH